MSRQETNYLKKIPLPIKKNVHTVNTHPPFLNFPFTYLFLITFLYYFISFSFIYRVRIHISIQYYGNISLVTLTWLSHRFQRVVVDGHTSNSCPVLSGVPQGSVLDPTVYNRTVLKNGSCCTVRPGKVSCLQKLRHFWMIIRDLFFESGSTEATKIKK